MNETRPQPFNITVLRHGESVGNAESRWQGQTDYPLTDIGRAQARELASRWKKESVKFDLIISSPLMRAHETASIIADVLKVKIEMDPLWIERDSGEFAGLTSSEVRQNFQHPPFTTPYDPVGVDGEGDWELFLRAGQALQNLIKREPGRYLIVSHGGLLNQFMHAVLGVAPQANNAGTRFRFGNTAFAELIYFPHLHRWTIEKLNDHGHWQDA
jgi:broad specificity phosphatase PhoE